MRLAFTSARVAKEAVFQLLLVGSSSLPRTPCSAGTLSPYFSLKYSASSVFKKMSPPGAVGDGVEKLDGHPVLVHQHAERAFSDAVKRHMLQRAALFLLNVRCLRDLL